MDPYFERMQRIERSLMDLGSELFYVKGELTSVKAENQAFSDLLKALRELLDEKGIINTDDFDSAVDLNRLVLNDNSPHDTNVRSEVEIQKKFPN